MNIYKQTPSQKFWKDESGTSIPVSRLTRSEKLAEKASYAIATKALKISGDLSAFKAEIKQLSETVYNALLEENGIKNGTRKGNFTWFNFDRSIKIELDLQESIKFDEVLIGLAQEKLTEFISSAISGSDDFIKDMVLDAFNKTNGRLDVRKVLGLRRHKQRAKDGRYHEAMELIDKAIRRPDSKLYFRVFVRDENGVYNSIDLNFSSIRTDTSN